MRKILSLLLLTAGVFLSLNARAHYNAKYEPPDGGFYHGVGWQLQAQSDYQEMMPDSLQPLVFQMMSDLPGMMRRGGMTVEGLLRAFHAEHIDRESQYIELSTHFKRDGETVDDVFANTDELDGYIDTLAAAFRRYGRPIFFRIAYEVNGAWNAYHPYILPRAFRKLVEGVRERGADNFATVWCYEPDAPGDFADSTGRGGWKWYPGDDVVDWFGLDPFDADHFDPDEPDSIQRGDRWVLTKKGKTEKFLRFAHARGKPVYLNELSARHVWITPHDEDVDSTRGEVDWNRWFEPFFAFLDNHPAIKGLNYINLDWTRFDQWEHWGDARLQINEYIRDRWIDRLSGERFLHAGYEIPEPEEPPDRERIVWTSANNVQDYDRWLSNDQAWGSVLENLDVFGLHENMLDGRNPLPANLVAEFQNRTGKAIGIEAGGLRMHYGQGDTCGEHAAGRELAKYGRIVRAGGSVDYLNLDSPIGYMLRSNDGAYTPSEAARELADYIEIVDAAIPGMSIGINEPIPWYSVDEFPSHPAQDRGDLLEILDIMMDTLRARNITIDYFNCDCPYDYTVNRHYNGFAKLIRIQEWCHENDLRFGVMYNSARGGARSDSLFYADVMRYYNQLADSGCIPENLLVWSWYDHPTHALPEDEPYTFTYTMREFMEAAGKLDIKSGAPSVPASFKFNVYPNPFNSTLNVEFVLGAPVEASISLFDVDGRKVAELAKRNFSAGSHSVGWRAEGLASGVYFVRLKSSRFSHTSKTILIR